MATAFWEKIKADPQAFGEFIRVWMFVALGLGLFVLDDAQQAQILTAISVTITFLTRKASTANVHVEEKVQKEVLHREATGTGIGTQQVGTGDGRA